MWAAAAWLYQSFFGEVAKLMANPAVAKKNQAAKIGVVVETPKVRHV